MMHRFSKIVYVVSDNTNESSPSFVKAANLAKANQAHLTLLKTLREIPKFGLSQLIGVDKKVIEEKILEEEKLKMQRLISSLDAGIHAQSEFKVGKMHIEVIRAAQLHHYDLVIKETDDVNWLRIHFDSNDMHLLRNCPCPVWLMKKDETPEFRNIMAAVDFDSELEVGNYSYNNELNKKILELSASLSLSDLTTLHVTTAYDVPEAGFVRLWVDQPEKVERDLFQAEYRRRQHGMNMLMEDFRIKMGEESFKFLSPRTHFVEGSPERELPKLAKTLNADLIVMGTVGRSGIAGVMIGNTAETILSQLQCSVLAIKPADFVSPIQ